MHRHLPLDLESISFFSLFLNIGGLINIILRFLFNFVLTFTCGNYYFMVTGKSNQGFETALIVSPAPCGLRSLADMLLAYCLNFMKAFSLSMVCFVYPFLLLMFCPFERSRFQGSPIPFYFIFASLHFSLLAFQMEVLNATCWHISFAPSWDVQW